MSGMYGTPGERFSITRFKPGYVIHEVDEFFLRVEAGSVTAEDVRSVRFNSTRFKPGYDEEAVDDALDEAIRRLGGTP